MLYTKFQGSLFLGSGEDFLKVFMGKVAILVNRLQPFE